MHKISVVGSTMRTRDYMQKLQSGDAVPHVEVDTYRKLSKKLPEALKPSIC